MDQRKIIFIHGKNTKPEPATHRRLLLRSLQGGVARLADLAPDSQIAEEDFLLCAWSDLLYPEYEAPDVLEDAIERMLGGSGIYQQQLTRLAGIGVNLKRSIFRLVDALPALIRFVPGNHIEFMLQGALEYMENHDGVGDAILDRLSACLIEGIAPGDRLLIIGHSLGSIVAFDFLTDREDILTQTHVDLITMGSPLGLHFTQARLLGAMQRFPHKIRHWKNFSAAGDLVSLDKTLGDDFECMLEQGLLNSLTDTIEIRNNYHDSVRGFNPHKSYAYLANPEVASVIADWYFNDWEKSGAGG